MLPQWAGLGEAFMHLLQLPVLLGLVGGALVGIFTGAIPGLQASIGIALLLPIVFYWPPEVGLVMLTALWQADNFGGSVSSILLGIPGTPGAVMTVLDGHEMAKQGKATQAIGVALAASAVGGTLGALSFLILAPPLATVAVKFGPSEYFLLAIIGLVLVASSSRAKLAKGLIAGGVGLLMAVVGIDSLTGYARFTFGTNYLMDGIDIVILCLGIFAIGSLLAAGAESQKILQVAETKGSLLDGMRIALRYRITLLRSAIIGMLVGVLPGTGITVATPLAYQQTVSFSKHPETFGKGDPEGVCAPETANNAVQGGALVPTMTLGIPGSVTAAVFMGALIMYGIRIGPRVFVEQPVLVWTIWWSIIGAVVFFILWAFLLKPLFTAVVTVPLKYLIPIVLVLGIGGGYSTHNSPLDIVAIIVIGFIGYFLLERHQYPMVPLVLGFILGPLAEKNYYRALMISQGSYGIFFQGIINPILWAILIAMLVMYFRGEWKERRKKKQATKT